MLYISAGHHFKDSGAIGVNGLKESAVTIIQRDLVCKELDKQGVKYTKDDDNETLAQYLNRIKTTPRDVVIEWHCNAFNKSANGTETLVADNANSKTLQFAKEMNDITCFVLGTTNRGVKTEKDSHRGKLGLMRESGIVILIELFFIDNPNDLKKWELNKEILAIEYVKIIKKYIL